MNTATANITKTARPLTSEQRSDLHLIAEMCRANGGSTRLDALRGKATAFERRGLIKRISGGGLVRWSMTAAGSEIATNEEHARIARREVNRANRGSNACL
jgi:hypothetical protein